MQHVRDACLASSRTDPRHQQFRSLPQLMGPCALQLQGPMVGERGLLDLHPLHVNSAVEVVRIH